ncbi:ribonuclease P protein component [Saccharibacter floricola]|uniref:ribonuclease P protein component n=1 Tax=Saccharibacter floricola TaxID=231053 RepID=UPI003571087B
MMKQPDRLQKRSQFLYVARKGRKIVTPGLIAQVLPCQGAQAASVGFTVTKKVGNSVIRNRTKRRLREALRLTVQEHGLSGGQLVFIGRAATRSRPFEKLKQDVQKAVLALSDAHK